jgi:hypothetical protein
VSLNRTPRFAIAAIVPAAIALVASTSATRASNPLVPAARETEPVVLTGAQLDGWSAPSNQTAKMPLADLLAPDPNPHNHYSDPDVDTGNAFGDGQPVERLLGYRWDDRANAFVQIPFQVDEVFTRYLDNTASGFSPYSGQDQHTTYAYDREGFRFTRDGPSRRPCRAQPDSAVARDPVPGLDDNDELAFMASDSGPPAPAGVSPPPGIQAVRRVTVSDPTASGAPARYVYVMLAREGGPKPAFDDRNGYVSYRRALRADDFAFSESSYESYGNAAPGLYCDDFGRIVRNPDGSPKMGRRRPRDWATVSTPRYRFRYDGRWLMTSLQVAARDGGRYGPDLIDRWKARAFAQDPGSETPCCGFEEEDSNWGGSSTLLGERTGPVRAIRETWGADSGTNVIRRETFYREELRMKTWLRVHVIPPLDGIYAQWDFNAGRITTFYNPRNPGGVAVDGRNDEVYGNLDDPCNARYDGNDTGVLDRGYRTLYRQLALCNLPYHQSVDVADFTFGDVNSALSWSEVAGPWGTIVDRYSAQLTDVSPGGTAQSLVAVPYYRDDSCFDDGTGTDPGPKLKLRSGDEPSAAADGSARRCWRPADGLPRGSDHFYQGSIATHGLHLLFVAESDNARLTIPVTEIVGEQRMVMLPGDAGNVGERYGRAFEKPLVASVG